MDNVKVADDYKDRLFRMIFNDKEKLLELYKYMVNNSSSRKKYASPKAGTELYFDLVFRQ